MAEPTDLLHRFRLIAAPDRAGVPVDDAAVRREELAPMIVELGDSEQRTDRVPAQARSMADCLMTNAAHVASTGSLVATPDRSRSTLRGTSG